MIFFTGDHHFFHKKIIIHCKRPFENEVEMNYALIDAWNAKVGPDDIVYHLGDFTLGGRDLASAIFTCLNGRIIVLHNSWHHDKKWLRHHSDSGHSPKCYKSRSDHWVIFTDPLVAFDVSTIRWVVLCHYALRTWDRRHHGSWHLYGHSHGTLEDEGLSMDVGVDAVSRYGLEPYAPVSLDEVRKIMEGRVRENGSWDRSKL